LDTENWAKSLEAKIGLDPSKANQNVGKTLIGYVLRTESEVEDRLITDMVSRLSKPKSVMAVRECLGCPPNGDGTTAKGEPDRRCKDGSKDKVGGGVSSSKIPSMTKDIDELTGNRGIRTLAVYGGRAFEPQIEALASGVEIVVGTPGRLLDLYRQGQLKLKEVSRVVLDEADEMLDLGFLPDVEKIFTSTPNRAQTMLFSATMPGDIIALARRFMNQPIHIRTQDNEDEGAVVSRIKQHVLRAHALDKIEMLARILQADGRGPTIVFCRTKRTCQKTSDDLLERGFRSASIHGDLGQSAREKALNDFKAGKSDVLVATDVAARGIDIDGITHVINYQCPEDEKTYVHRIGRTARAGAEGISVTFVDWDDLARWKMIDTALNLGLGEPEETYSSSEHLYEIMNIPAGSNGRITKQKAAVKPEKSQPVSKVEKPAAERTVRNRTRTKKFSS
jgi:superfamily II DNA/RNA helicase